MSLPQGIPIASKHEKLFPVVTASNINDPMSGSHSLADLSTISHFSLKYKALSAVFAVVSLGILPLIS